MTGPMKKRPTSKPRTESRRNPVLDPEAKTGVKAEASVTKREAVQMGKPLPSAPVKFVRRDIVKCSACGQDHTRVLFILRDDWMSQEYQYAAKCPVSGEEILAKVGD